MRAVADLHTHAVNILHDRWLGFAWQWTSLFGVASFLPGATLLTAGPFLCE
jgi:hypothetical protein